MTLKIVKERKSLERIIQIRLLLLKNLFKKNILKCTIYALHLSGENCRFQHI